MIPTVVVRGSAGAIWTMDVPPAGHLREMFDEKLADGSLVVVDAPSEVPSVAPDAPRRGRPPKVREFADQAVEAAPVEGD